MTPATCKPVLSPFMSITRLFGIESSMENSGVTAAMIRRNRLYVPLRRKVMRVSNRQRRWQLLRTLVGN
ncbi:MAG: hypothetical protein MI754_01470 [Chromatiales bacterium]|nr:hypothetical protein [Chromatiales bacterium]